MAQNIFIQDAIDREAIESWADTHHQSCFSSECITPKTT